MYSKIEEGKVWLNSTVLTGVLRYVKYKQGGERQNRVKGWQEEAIYIMIKKSKANRYLYDAA